jgi:hypothetical protein
MILKLFFYQGGSDTLIAIASNLTEIYLITFDIETMGMKEQIKISNQDNFVDTIFSDESDQILLIEKLKVSVFILNHNKEL